MSGYLFWNKQSDPQAQAILDALTRAGDAYHHTMSWGDDDYGDGSCLDHIEKAVTTALVQARREGERTGFKAGTLQALQTLRGVCAVPVEQLDKLIRTLLAQTPSKEQNDG
ncbi:MAG: hypothetical protein VW239_02065 [Candidatus Nanopelagicales bacterium]